MTHQQRQVKWLLKILDSMVHAHKPVSDFQQQLELNLFSTEDPRYLFTVDPLQMYLLYKGIQWVSALKKPVNYGPCCPGMFRAQSYMQAETEKTTVKAKQTKQGACVRACMCKAQQNRSCGDEDNICAFQ